jgi:SAM-dependent methyltransferase
MMTTKNDSHKKCICPVCGTPDPIPFIKIPLVPIFCNQLFPSFEEAIDVQKGTINLSFCEQCGHVFNTAFKPELMKYSQAYENSLHFSSRFQEYARTLAEELIRKYDLNGKDVIEIGCGKGDFLDMLCEFGSNRGIGFDPSYEEERFDKREYVRFKVVKDLYSEKYADQKADIICCRHVLEHIEEPRHFIQSVRRTVGDSPETIVFFEVPNVMFTLKDFGIWDLIYEHCGYFSKPSLAHLFNSCGFKVLSLSDTFGGQFECIEAKPAESQPEGENGYAEIVQNMVHYVNAFSDTYTSKIKEWQGNLEQMKNESKKVVVWGAGSKGVTFLNTLGVTEQVSYIVDVNPHKQGMHVAGTGQQIVSPRFLQEYQPDTILVMNPLYKNEIEKMIRDLNISCFVTEV